MCEKLMRGGGEEGEEKEWDTSKAGGSETDDKVGTTHKDGVRHGDVAQLVSGGDSDNPPNCFAAKLHNAVTSAAAW